MKLLYDADAVRAMVSNKLTHMTLNDLADELGVSTSYLCDYVHFRRAPGPKLLAGLGLVRVDMYTPQPGRKEPTP